MWNKINAGFNAEEETANFGTRACAVNDVAVYETNTLAAILAGDDKPTKLPTVCSQYCHQVGLCVAVDTSLTVFNEDCSTAKCVVTFQSDVEVLTVSLCGSFLLVGVSGQLSCFHIPTGGTKVFTKAIHSYSNLQRFILLDCYEANDHNEIYVVLSNGHVFKSSGINFIKLNEAMMQNDNVAVKQITEGISCQDVFQVQGLQSQVLIGLSLLNERRLLFLGSSNCIYMLNVDQFDQILSMFLDEYKIIKIGGIVNKSTLFALCNNGYILQICLHTLTSTFLWTELTVKDFVVLEGSVTYECNLLALIDEVQETKAVVFISWPDYKIKYRLPVEETSFLIHQKGADEILFLEGFGSEVIDTIRVKAIVESQPDLRLERILRRCKFEEAEKFARAFSLDLEIVYKAHVQKLCQDLSPWNSSLDHQKKMFNKILELIKKIKDHNFVAEICVSVIPPDFDMLHTMLMFGMDRFSKVTDKTGDSLQELLAKVSTIARRLDTCMLVYGPNTTIDHWIDFPKHDLVVSCLNHINRGEIKESILIWSRHLSDMKPLFTIEKAKQLLNALPNATKLQDLLHWLRHFVPPILSFFPNILLDVVHWTVQRAKNLEILESGSGCWPESGLTLAKCLLQLVHTPHTEQSILLQSQRVGLRNENWSHHSPMNQLLTLIDKLQDISLLKHTYGVNIAYDQFVQENHSDFVAALLERLPLEKISLFMGELFPRLMLERGLEPDTQILLFIQDIVMNFEDWWFWEEAPWEGRVSALIPHINSVEVKLNAILHVLRTAPVPWTSAVSQLAEQGIHLPHSKASDVRNECNYVPKRLIMKKYGILFDKKHEMQLVRLILKKNETNMLNDINELTKCVKDNIADLYVIIVIHLIENREQCKAWEVLNTVDDVCKSECLFRLLHHMQRLIAFDSWEKLPAYFVFMPSMERPKEKHLYKEIKNIYNLKMEFDISTTCSELCLPKERQNILKYYASKLEKDLMSESLKESAAIKKVCRLTYLLFLTPEEGIIALSGFCVENDLLTALSIINQVHDFDNKPPRVYKMILQLINHMLTFYKPMESNSTLINTFTSVTSSIAKRFQAYSTYSQFWNVLKWISLLHQGSVSAKSVLKTIYGDPSPTTATAILIHSSVKNIIYCSAKSTIKEKKNTTVNESINGVMVQPLVDATNESRELIATWQRLKEEQQDLSCILLICEYNWSQKSSNTDYHENQTINTFLIHCIRDLLRKLFRLHNFDIELALSLLDFFSTNEAMEFLVREAQSVGYNYQRLSSISQLALVYSSLNNIVKYTKNFKKYHVSCKWAKKLNELGLPYKDAFKDTDTDHRLVIQKLITLPSTTISLLKEFCLDMFFDIQECLMMYIEHLLLNWEPDIQISIDPTTGEKVMSVRNSQNDLLQKCRAILHELGIKPSKSEHGVISWSESIQNDLCNLWNKVNYYYYEVYSVLADLHQRVVPPHAARQITSCQTMLNFLRTYTRISPPNETEQDQWFQLFPNTNQLPPISNFRLPFTSFLTKEMSWSIIKPELSLKTYKIWNDVVTNLGLDRNMLFTLTIQRLSSDELGGGMRDKKSAWCLQACNNSVLDEIKECVSHIRNQEMASAALYYVVNHMPPGADQMAAATLCYLQAEQWIVQDNNDKARAGFAKVQKKYLTVSTSHILHSSGLGKPEYLQLVLHPQELICALYEDPSILLRKTGSVSHCPDINGVVFSIGQLHKANVVGIQYELLSEWLCPPDRLPLDVSCDDITQNIANIHNNLLVPSDNDNVIRACYLLESMDKELAAKYLVSYAGLRDELDCRPTAVRLRALQCLCSVATPDIVIKTTGRTLENIRANMQNLMFMSELEKLGLVWSAQGFEACDKEDVVRILLTKASPLAVQLAAAMGCTFKLRNTRYWDQILQLITSYSMIEELVIILPELTHICHLLNDTIFTAAWNCALISPLQKAEFPLSEEASRIVQRALELLYCCPVPRQLNLALMNHHCERLRDPQLTARLEPFLSLTSSDKQLKVNVKQEPTS